VPVRPEGRDGSLNDLTAVVNSIWEQVRASAAYGINSFPGWQPLFNEQMQRAQLTRADGPGKGLALSFYKDEQDTWLFERIEWQPSLETEGFGKTTRNTTMYPLSEISPGTQSREIGTLQADGAFAVENIISLSGIEPLNQNSINWLTEQFTAFTASIR